MNADLSRVSVLPDSMPAYNQGKEDNAEKANKLHKEDTIHAQKEGLKQIWH